MPEIFLLVLSCLIANQSTLPCLFLNVWLLMVLLSLILLSIDLLLAPFSTRPLRVQILPMLSIMLVNFCMPLLQITFLLSNVFFAMSKEHSTLVLPFVYPLFLVPVAYSDADWVGCPDTNRSTSDYSIILVTILFLRVPKSNLLFDVLSEKLSIMFLPQLLLNIFWLCIICMTSRFLFHSSPCSYVTTKVLFFLALILFLTSRTNMLN